jgi:hypothetical protein
MVLEEEDIPLDRKGAQCVLFLKWDGMWCPCYGSRLRANPRNTVNRRRKKAAVIYLPNL